MISPDRAIYVLLAALIALIIWFFIKTGYSPPTGDKPKRRPPSDPRTAELLRARKTILRQIEQQQAFAWRRSDFREEGRARLKAVLKEIDAELAGTARGEQTSSGR